MNIKLIKGDSLNYLRNISEEGNFDLTFLDMPFNQGKDYYEFNDNMDVNDYWKWMKEVCHLIFLQTSKGGCIYFMQREKNTQQVLETLSSTGWKFQNLIIWKKKSSACSTK